MTAHRTSLPGRPRTLRTQRGVATLLVVMALFFLVSMVAAYTSRNLIFEQRTSANQYRATQAFEAAEGGVEWALAKLNAGRVDAACDNTAQVGSDSFRQRYLVYDLNTGTASPQRWVSPDGPRQLSPVCSRTPAGWQCSCPRNGPSTLVAADTTSVQPSFSIRFEGTSTPGVIRASVYGCTGPNETCLNTGQASGDAAAGLNVTLTQLPALAAMPTAALTVRGNIELDNASTVINEDAATNAVAVQASGTVSGPQPLAVGAAGSPEGGRIITGDTSLEQASPERFFARFTGLSPRAFADQPNVVRLEPKDEATCPTGCADALRALARAHPWRPIYVPTDVVIDSAGDLGSPPSPVMLVVMGKLSWGTSGISVHGVVYARGAEAPAGSTGNWVQGAVISETSIDAPTLPGIRYDAEILQRVRQLQGSVIRLPGGWRDF